jgi:hypothetical protein
MMPEAPSWGRVLATTIGLWASRRWPRVRRPRRALLLPAICVLVLSAGAVGVVRFTSTSADVASPGRSHQGQLRAGAAARATADAGDFGDFGSLGSVRATAPGGASAYQPALQADLAARRSAGAQLLHSRRIQVSAQGAGQLEAGEVDSRLLIMLTMLASQHPWRVVAFGDASPGVPFAEAPFRQVVIAGANGRDGAAGLAAALALVRAQRAPYQAAQVTTVRLAGGQAGLRIDFAAPSPLGLLTGGARG